MDFSFPKPTDERFARISGLALIAATLMVMASTLLI